MFQTKLESEVSLSKIKVKASFTVDLDENACFINGTDIKTSLNGMTGMPGYLGFNPALSSSEVPLNFPYSTSLPSSLPLSPKVIAL